MRLPFMALSLSKGHLLKRFIMSSAAVPAATKWISAAMLTACYEEGDGAALERPFQLPVCERGMPGSWHVAQPGTQLL